jgi:hypothetical protein
MPVMSATFIMLGGWFEKNIMYIVFFRLCGYEGNLMYLVGIICIKTFLFIM